jgi:V-type H+-transporting ATPase subunit F
MARRYRGGEQKLVAIIGDEDTVTGFLLAGVGDANNKKKVGPNFFIVNAETSIADTEAVFRGYLGRADIGMILICQHIANDIRFAIEAHDQPLPCVLEIPSKQIPFDESKDPVLRKLNRMLGDEK